MTAALSLIFANTHSVKAQYDPGAGGIGDSQTSNLPVAPNGSSTPSIQGSLGAYGDPGGIRAFLGSAGIKYDFVYIGEVLGNVSGGVKRGATYEGRLDAQLDIDLSYYGLDNVNAHAETYQIHGRGLSGNNLRDLFGVSSIEASPDTKLYEAWVDKSFFEGRLSVRAGQLAADTEFLISQTAGLFLNASYGWPASFTNDLPSGGPAYPLATPAVRLRATPTKNIVLLAAVFNGDPAGPYRPGVDSYLPQMRDPGGTAFRLGGPPLALAEAQYSYYQTEGSGGLPGTIKVGIFHHFGDFVPAGAEVGAAATYRGNNGFYAVVDQAIYKVPGTSDQGAALFLRATANPSDRNLIDRYLDAGLTYKGLLRGRPDDTVGISGGYAHVSRAATGLDIAVADPLVRDYQAVVEATYQYVVLPGFTVQPDIQYVIHPGANGVADPNDGRPIRNAVVFGTRMTVHY